MQPVPLYYTGIGSRKTPEDVLDVMYGIGAWLTHLGLTLRSGAAEGADTAFEEGCLSQRGDIEMWLPWRGFGDRFEIPGFYPTQEHHDLAATLHPYWSKLKDSYRLLHARNTGQVLGMNLATPSKFVVCWTPCGMETEAERTKISGGTATAIVLAHRRGIPIFNLQRPGRLSQFDQFVRDHLTPFQ